MTAPAWPGFDACLRRLGFVPSRTGSVITTVFGDAVLPRGGALALSDLLALMRRLGASDGVVRTAVSRLAADGVLAGTRFGRSSAYALTDGSRAEFTAAIPAIYGPLDRPAPWSLSVAFPADPAERAALAAAGYAPVAPGALLGFDPVPPGIPALRSDGDPARLRELAARAWPAAGLQSEYAALAEALDLLDGTPPPTPLDAAAARTLLIHAFRRLALRTPRLPACLRPPGWTASAVRRTCVRLYRAWAPDSERWLDTTRNGPGPLPRGPDPSARFS